MPCLGPLARPLTVVSYPEQDEAERMKWELDMQSLGRVAKERTSALAQPSLEMMPFEVWRVLSPPDETRDNGMSCCQVRV